MQIALLPIWLLIFILTGCSETEPTPGTDIDPPLITAAESGDISALSQLLGERPVIDVRDACQWTPLMKAALNGHLQAARQLVAAGASIDLTDKGGYTAMMLAASNNHSEVVEFLLGKDADVDQAENTAGWTALIWAAKLGHFETVKILLDHKANPNLADFKGKRAIDWAIAGNFEAISSLLTASI
ncbi:MAG: ankyrin repeat domain-containing protein [Pseudomonadota bacterium]